MTVCVVHKSSWRLMKEPGVDCLFIQAVHAGL